MSIRCIDFGLGQLRDSGRELTNLRLGELMIASGYAVTGSDRSRNYAGTLPWHGSIKEVEKRLKETARLRARGAAQLDSALLDDDVRELQERGHKRLRDALNGLRLRGPNLLVQDVDESELTPLQQEALAWARAASRGEPVTS